MSLKTHARLGYGILFFLDPKYVWSFDVVRIVRSDLDLQKATIPNAMLYFNFRICNSKRDGPASRPNQNLPVRPCRSSGELGPGSH